MKANSCMEHLRCNQIIKILKVGRMRRLWNRITSADLATSDCFNMCNDSVHSIVDTRVIYQYQHGQLNSVLYLKFVHDQEHIRGYKAFVLHYSLLKTQHISIISLCPMIFFLRRRSRRNCTSKRKKTFLHFKRPSSILDNDSSYGSCGASDHWEHPKLYGLRSTGIFAIETLPSVRSLRTTHNSEHDWSLFPLLLSLLLII